MAKVHDRFLEIVATTAQGAQTVVASKVNYYRTKAELDAATPFTFAATFPAAGASPYDIVLGEAIPAGTILRLTVTINA